jgi:hypothetical protein
MYCVTAAHIRSDFYIAQYKVCSYHHTKVYNEMNLLIG